MRFSTLTWVPGFTGFSSFEYRFEFATMFNYESRHHDILYIAESIFSLIKHPIIIPSFSQHYVVKMTYGSALARLFL
jgi:hypothetical protein